MLHARFGGNPEIHSNYCCISLKNFLSAGDSHFNLIAKLFLSSRPKNVMHRQCAASIVRLETNYDKLEYFHFDSACMTWCYAMDMISTSALCITLDPPLESNPNPCNTTYHIYSRTMCWWYENYMLNIINVNENGRNNFNAFESGISVKTSEFAGSLTGPRFSVMQKCKWISVLQME